LKEITIFAAVARREEKREAATTPNLHHVVHQYFLCSANFPKPKMEKENLVEKMSFYR